MYSNGPDAARIVRTAVLDHFEQIVRDNKRRTKRLQALAAYVRKLPPDHPDMRKLAECARCCDQCGEPILHGTKMFQEATDENGDRFAALNPYLVSLLSNAANRSDAGIADWFSDWVDDLDTVQFDENGVPLFQNDADAYTGSPFRDHLPRSKNRKR